MAGAAKGYCGKKTSGYTDSFGEAILANGIRMMLCIVIEFVIVLVSGDVSTLIPSAKMLGISALSGIFTAVFVVTWLISVKKSAYMMVDIFLMLGVLIPLIASNIFFGETIKMTQWMGIALLFVAVILMCSYNNSIKAKLSPSALFLLLLCGVSSGIADFSQKLFTKCIQDSSAAAFNLYTYLFAALILVVFFAVTRKKRGSLRWTESQKNIWFYFDYGNLLVCQFLFQDAGLRIFKCRAALPIKPRVCFDFICGDGFCIVIIKTDRKSHPWYSNCFCRSACDQFAIRGTKLSLF